MENGREKQVIYVKDLVFRALHQWKLILVVALAFAVLLGAYAVAKDGETVTITGLNVTPETQEKIDQLTIRCDFYENLVENQRKYIAESPYMAIDPYATYTCGFHLFPEPTYDVPVTEFVPVEQDTGVLLRAYRSLLIDSATFEVLSQQFGYSVQDLQDLVVLDAGTDSTLGIRVYGKAPEEIREIAGLLESIVLETQETISQQVHSHELKVIRFQKGPAYDSSVASSQNSYYRQLSDYEDTWITAKNELQRYKPTQLVAESGNPMLYAIIGAVLGAFLVVCVLWVIHLCSDKVYSSRVLVNRTGVRVLGCTDSGKKRFFIDRWLRKLEGRSGDEAAALAANIRNRCQDSKTILFMGTFKQDALSGVTAALEQAGICCKICATKEEALEALPGCDGVVLAETCNASLYAQVEWAMETVSDYQKNLIGCVLIDG